MPASSLSDNGLDAYSGAGKPHHEQDMRLARYLAACGVDSRRKCETIIASGRVTVNGEKISTPAINVNPRKDLVALDGVPVRPEEKTYVLLYKPPGYTCSADDPHAEYLVTDLLPDELGRLFTVGRLDRDSEGVLICTNDGELANRLTHPSYRVSRTYRVTVDRAVSESVCRTLRRGVYNHGEFLRPDVVKVCRRASPAELEIVLRQGRKREIRRLCYEVGLSVLRLVRVAFDGVPLSGMSPGQWRRLTDEEVQEMFRRTERYDES